MVGYPESLSSIGAIQQICEALSENPIKPVFPTFFLAQNVFFFPLKLPFLLLTDLLQSIGQLSCEFEPNRSCTAKLGMVSVV